MNFEKIPQPKKAELSVVHGVESSREDIPRLDSEELERICRLDVSDDELLEVREMTEDHPKAVPDVVQALLARDFKNELPIEEPIFVYKRNLQECERLRKKMFSILGSKDTSKESEQEMANAASKLLALELRKAEWLEDEFYPNVFGSAVTTARAEVNQFLIRQKNTKSLEYFHDARFPEVRMMDELSFLLEGNPPQAGGVYRPHQDTVDLRIPEFFTDRDEWRVYLIAVHELLHSVSHQDWEGIGMDKRAIDPDLEALNEAVTQLLTYHIALEHLEKEKTPLRGQRQSRLSLAAMPYSDYTLIVRQVFSKIPMEYFTDAMLNESGWEKLREKFKEVFGSEKAIIKYARNLREAYLPPKQRKKGADVIPFPNILKSQQTAEDSPEEG